MNESAAVPPKLTAVAPVKPAPLITTGVVLTQPLEGLKLAITGVQEFPETTPPGATQLEVAPDKAKLVSVPVRLLPLASVREVTPVFTALATPWFKGKLSF